ncbi:single-stranded DNA-binding protein [uncultured Thiocystis sp.]|jgi:single-strand DNA-binding protein|uniref:single-stranded DNA-binding protein n=1 Tax=uncultured Thiocystis sp. TaxID=1202134 RepID=UPI0025FCFFF5|nr:single-stranded DNA-binding protein [uncultured Thiocystis sp.]
MTIIASVYGRLAFAPTERTTKAGKPMGTARLAVEAGSNAETQETWWIDLLAFGTNAESLLVLAKGQMVSAVGKLTKGRYTTKDGEEREQFTLLADTLVSARTARPKANPGARQREPAPPRGDDFGDEIPF